MTGFQYADEQLSERELMIALPSFMIGVEALSMPREVASATTGLDGVFSVIAAGVVVAGLTWWTAKFVSKFPRESFLTYASRIVTKPIACILSLFFIFLFVAIAAYQVRSLADIGKIYLFDQTPIEVASLSFLLIIVYAVGGSRAGIMRINMLFIPFIIIFAFVVFFFNINWFEVKHVTPLFQTDINGYIKGLGRSIFFGGFIILWFYIAYVENPKDTPKMVTKGILIPLVLFTILYVGCIAAYSNVVTSNLIYPTIELAKMIEIPGGILERFDSIFFVIWIMAIFNTAAMAYDLAVLGIQMLLKRKGKKTIVLSIAPVVFFIAMLPRNLLEVSTFGEVTGYVSFYYSIAVLLLFVIIAKFRGVKGNG
ncbi:spore germination protein GerLB [Gracilibacillus halophilus YIM-C55.5]|uniref:Spore germination protein GerLB n=1 Tax=Gracilibacillus halophilus YIM-C55.5 TaxID=1308866 RepID=N4WU48_9BACI|nr:endospore germination permease [Gracilibacillus halophilus]ENH96631.1 spore germination protein GerLB [Gracilibacillus halophilus YIM-C55.5]